MLMKPRIYTCATISSAGRIKALILTCLLLAAIYLLNCLGYIGTFRIGYGSCVSPSGNLLSLDKFNYKFTSERPPEIFRFLLEPTNVCRHDRQPWIVYILAGPAEFRRRIVLRQTWASSDMHDDFSFFFILGIVSDEDVMRRVRREAELFQDILVAEFVDSYRNLTYKGVHALHFLNTRCPNVDWVVKADTDVYVDLHKLHSKYRVPTSRTMIGRYRTNEFINRTETYKWTVDEMEFPETETFPPYFIGFSYAFSGDMVALLLEACQRTPFFWLEDIYFGVLFNQIEGSRAINDSYFKIFRRDVENRLDLAHNNTLTRLFLEPENRLSWTKLFEDRQIGYLDNKQ